MAVDPDSDDLEGTRIDLGDDLLQGLAEEVPLRSTPPSNLDHFRNAQILRNEGLFDDAKETLRKILREDPSHVRAQDLLNEIQAQELARFMNVSSDAQADERKIKAYSETKKKIEQILEVDFPESWERLSVEDMQEIVDRLLAKTDLFSSIDWTSLCIAFLELELYAAAASISKRYLGKIMNKGNGDSSKEYLSALALHIQALVLADHATEAILSVEEVSADVELPRSEKIEFFYWMGRAYEKKGQNQEAQMWYKLVNQISPGYRDVELKLKGL